MEYMLPPDVLIHIFFKLPLQDILSVSKTCTYWHDILQEFVGKREWSKLLKIAEKSSLRLNTCSVLKNVDTSKIDVLNSCCRLSDTFFDGSEKLYKCLTYDNFIPSDEVILKTHHSQIIIQVYVGSSEYPRPGYVISHLNNYRHQDESFSRYRTTDKIIDNLKTLLNYGMVHHVHYRTMIYCYPLALHGDLKERFVKYFFEQCHFRYVVMVPRVMMLCENLSVTDAVVVYSSSRATEVVVVLNGCVSMERWREVPVGGWQVAEQLHSAYQWINPLTNLNVTSFDTAAIKQECWLNTSAVQGQKRDVASKQVRLSAPSGHKMFTLKHERYLAAEVMYTQLNLSSIIHELLQGLSADVKSNCLNHILLSGGNCQLKYLSIRLTRDLLKMYPEYEHVISVSVHGGKMCYTYPPSFFKSNMQKKYEAGRKVGITVEDYIIGDF